jgi:hypothetical protein
MDPMEAAPLQGDARESEDREDAKGFSAKEAGESQRSGQPSRPEASVAESLSQPERVTEEIRVDNSEKRVIDFFRDQLRIKKEMD